MLFLIQSCGGDSGSDVSVSSRVDSQITPSKTGIEIVSIKNNAPLHEQTDVLLSTNILNNNNATITYQWHQV